jgi:hypothetical protein
VAKRLERLPRIELGHGLELRVARTRRARLLGLAGLPGLPEGVGLLLPRCRHVHTIGMRFEIDVVHVRRDGRPQGDGHADLSAAGVIETRAREGARFAAALERGGCRLVAPWLA